MTRLTTRGDQRRRSPLAHPPPAQDRRRPLAAVLADPRVRLGAGTAVVLVTARAARRDRISPAEVTAFRAVNGLPDSIHLLSRSAPPPFPVSGQSAVLLP